MLRIQFIRTPREIALRWMPQNTFDDKSAVVQVMAWRHQTRAITLANDDQDQSRHMVSPAHSELTWAHGTIDQWLRFTCVQ